MKACGFKPLTILALREKCSNKEFLLVRVFSHLYWTRRFTPYSVFIYLYNYFIYSVQMRQIRTRKNSVFGQFSGSESYIIDVGKAPSRLFSSIVPTETSTHSTSWEWLFSIFPRNELCRSTLLLKLITVA